MVHDYYFYFVDRCHKNLQIGVHPPLRDNPLEVSTNEFKSFRDIKNDQRGVNHNEIQICQRISRIYILLLYNKILIVEGERRIRKTKFSIITSGIKSMCRWVSQTEKRRYSSGYVFGLSSNKLLNEKKLDETFNFLEKNTTDGGIGTTNKFINWTGWFPNVNQFVAYYIYNSKKTWTLS
ncbi:hypothetical protein BCR32DRAFT_286682 [Anaeromyces robustus]|uniref:Uncharacterized protein n=1 Tax=Anaeromyces robustus TaxID=1754192 RepID=A0A1Y1VUX6_9FUNG|nr:hypothetical protein BCR32DRAFT_286682 [Anaeromyces robustus]|eukprot:ORX65101.1 hypothetical protein BCR32DRAFT_286682 [Anaeromyces robustus]